jgi:hypothetical protein
MQKNQIKLFNLLEYFNSNKNFYKLYSYWQEFKYLLLFEIYLLLFINHFEKI